MTGHWPLPTSEGFFDRWLVVPFDRRFRGEGREIPADQLDATLSEPSELSGLLNRALDVLTRLRRAGRFMESASLAIAFLDFHAATDPLSVWLDTHTIESPELITTKKALRSAFNAYREKSGRPPVLEKAFGAAFKKLRPQVNDAQRTVHGKVQWCYLGIGLRQEMAQEAGCAFQPDYPESQNPSLVSRDSRDIPSLNLSHARKEEAERECEFLKEQDRGNRVNRVNPVKEDYSHEYVDEPVDGRIRTSCRLCGKFHGYRPLAPDRNGSLLHEGGSE